MKLPVIRDTEGQQLDKSTCIGQDNCSSCSLFEKNGGRCSGCTPAHKSQMADNFKWCFKECGTCTGFKVNVPAICCRSPLKDVYLTAVTKGAKNYNEPEYDYTPRPELSFKTRAVFYISSGGVGTITAGGKQLVPDGTEVVAVNLSRVWSGNGFYSRDLKDYLHLPAKTKLILMTMTLDDMLERAFEKELYADPLEFQRAGLDAWMPLSFSAYPEDAHMHQYYQLVRTLYCTEKSQAWFTTGDHRMPGIRTDDLVLEAVKKIPQMVFNMQFSMEDKWFKFHLNMLAQYHKLVPANVSFWLVGAATPSFIHNVRKQCGKRPVYFVSAKPLYLTSKGQQMTLAGGSKKSTTAKPELLVENMAMFSKMVQEYGR